METTMRAVVLTSYADPPNLSVQRIPVPHPQTGQVLVRIECAPINPSDLEFIKGTYAYKKALPTVPGFEGAGIVVTSGGGFLSNLLVNRRVAARHSPKGLGTWAEYMVCEAENCTLLQPGVEYEQAACMFMNPLTALMFREILTSGKHKAVIQTAANSALGRMVSRLMKASQITVVNVVRSEEAAKILREEGESLVLNSTDSQFESSLIRLSNDLQISIAFDAVAGDLTGALIHAVQPYGVVYVYGLLSGRPSAAVDPADLIFQNKRLEGLWMPVWLRTHSVWRRLSLMTEVQRLIGTVLKSEIARKCVLESIQETVQDYQSSMSAGKFLLVPHVLGV